MRHMQKAVSSLGFCIRAMKKGGAGACAMLSTTDGSLSRTVQRPSLLGTVGVFLSLVLIPILLLAATAAALSLPGMDGVLMAIPAVAASSKSGSEPKKPVKIREMESNLKQLLRELEEGQTEMATSGALSQERGEELEQKAHEAEELQEQLDRYNRIAGVAKKGREVDKVTLPGEEHGGTRTLYTTPGHLFVLSDEFKQYVARGKEGWSAKVEVGRRLGRKTMLRGEQALSFQRKAFDPATLSALGDDAIIEVDRDRELVRYEEPEILTIRDVLNVVPTGSDAIKFVRHVATTRAAESQASRGGAKPYLKVTFEPDTVSVETIAVLSKVTEQDIEDAPRLVGYINGEMTLDVRTEEERQLLWGSGASGEIKGLFHADHGIDEFDRAEAEDTVIDIIRKMRTDLRRRRVTPTFTTVDPLDWETIELTKGTDDHYIWGLITDLRGPRIWSLRVVESDAMTNPETNERRVLVGDGVRGATLYDRNNIRLAVGYVDDDFARNLRTLRAEERLALAVKRAFAFEYAITAAASS